MSPIREAIDRAGGPARVAAMLNVSTQAVCFWRDGARGFPVEHCATLHAASGVPRWHLRPNDWHRIWPELVGQEGAPPVPVEKAAA